MAVKLRLSRFGRLNHPTYRICATDSRFKRDGRVIETLGYYLPKHPREAEQVSLNSERIEYWLSVGAKPSETVATMLRKANIEIPVSKRHGSSRKPKAKPFEAPKRVGTGRLAKKKWRAKHAG